MIQELTSQQAAQALNITERAVRRRAEREQWFKSPEKIRGGYKNTYMYARLPRQVQIQLAAAISTLKPDAAKETGLADYACLPGARKKEAEARLEILWARDAFIKHAGLHIKEGSNIFCKNVMDGEVDLADWVVSAITKNNKTSLSWATLNRWQKAYQKNGLAGLAARYVNSGRPSGIADDMKQFVVSMKVDHPHIGLSKIMAGLQARFSGKNIPNISVVRRYLNQWVRKNKSLLEYIANPDQWKNNRMFAAGSRSENIVRLNQMWEMDSTPTDVMLTDGRHNISGVIDIFSRRLKLLVSKTAKADAHAALIRRSIIDWGVPEIIKMDNGKDYTANHITRVLDGLEITQSLCAPFSPEQKPFVERALGTFSHDIVELLPGYIGHNVADRKAVEARRSFSQRLMKQGEDPVNINMTADEFQDICNRWVNAVYHYNKHSGLNGKTPAQIARDWKEPVRKIKDERALDILLSPAPAGDGFRVIGKKGVKIGGGYYIAPEMAGYEGCRVSVLLDITDFGAVYVYEQSGTFLCRAVDPDRSGISRKDLAVMVRKAQKQVMKDGRKELKKMAREAKTKTIHSEILDHREKQIANISEFPKQEAEYTTPSIEEAVKAAHDERIQASVPVPEEITQEQEEKANEIISLSHRKRLPANDWEKYDMLSQDLAAGIDVPDSDLAWMKRYEMWLETGKNIVNQ